MVSIAHGTNKSKNKIPPGLHTLENVKLNFFSEVCALEHFNDQYNLVEATLRNMAELWYVDVVPGSLQAYEALGLTCKVGGRLQASRNLALEDASRLQKRCLMMSDHHYRLAVQSHLNGLDSSMVDYFRRLADKRREARMLTADESQATARENARGSARTGG